MVPEIPAIGQGIGVSAGFHLRPDARRRQQEYAAYPIFQGTCQVVVVADAHAKERIGSERARLNEAPSRREGQSTREIRVRERRAGVLREKSASGRRNCVRGRNAGASGDA